MTLPGLAVRNGEASPVAALPILDSEDFVAEVGRSLRDGARIAALFGVPEDRLGDPSSRDLRLVALLARESGHALSLLSARVTLRFTSLTPELPQAHRFEREIYEQWGVVPEGHPWLKPVRFQAPYRVPDGVTLPAPEIGVTDFFRVGGSEIHEVAVGPVHAGIIEPGHFRFQCHGEHVYHLEIALGYQHRGVERALVGGPDARSIHYVETLSGDTTVGHALAYACALEALGGARAPEHAWAVRAVALELERLANHTGDLGALAQDVGFLPTSAYCGRIRGDFLNLTALLCGSRFGRGLVRPGGVGFGLDPPRAAELLARLSRIAADQADAVELLWSTHSVMARFEGVGALSSDLGREIGLVGPAARAAGIARDVRSDFPMAGDVFAGLPPQTAETGDVLARALVRWRECQASLAFLSERLAALPAPEPQPSVTSLRPQQIAVALTEGWRGEICHVATTDAAGRLAHYKVVDPSFHNWAGLALALRDQQISDFPLCNKSFNLSYCGQDL